MIDLPKKDENNVNYISYSQIKMWNEEKTFLKNYSGKEGYIRRYFFKEKEEDFTGYSQFGTEVENYITLRMDGDKFSNKEKQLLETIKPLGVFQKEFRLEYDDFYVIGYIDDLTEDFSKIRDYKTASEKSSKKYYEDDYHQLDLYSLGVKSITNKLPKEMEVVCIERIGNGFRGGRSSLYVGENVWYIPRKTNKKRLDSLEKNIISSVKEISEYYKVFNKLNNSKI